MLMTGYTCKINETASYIWQNVSNNITVECFDYILKPTPTEALLMNQIAPSMIILTVITNVLICIVLTRRHMISPTNIILLGMAIADMLTGLFPLPIYLAKNFAAFSDPVTVNKSYVNYYLVTFLPTLFHTVSVWLTVTLAVQRFIYITFPVRVSQICTERNSKITTLITSISAFLFHCIGLQAYFLDYTHTCHSTESGEPISSSRRVMKCDVNSIPVLMVFYGTRVILLNVAPCLLLALFTILLMIALHRAETKRKSLILHSNRKSDSRRMKESNSTLKMLVVVLVSFLIVEVPTGIVISTYMISQLIGVTANYDWSTIMSVFNFCILVSYPMNFFIYCGMSQQFRNTFRSLVGLGQRNQSADMVELTRGAKPDAVEVEVEVSEIQPLRDNLVANHTTVANGNNGEGGSAQTSEIVKLVD